MAARYADGWNYASNLDGTLEGFIERRDALRRACEAIGRDPAELTISAQIIIPRDAERPPSRHGTGDRLRPGGERRDPADDPGPRGRGGIRRLATEVAAPFRDAFG